MYNELYYFTFDTQWWSGLLLWEDFYDIQIRKIRRYPRALNSWKQLLNRGFVICISWYIYCRLSYWKPIKLKGFFQKNGMYKPKSIDYQNDESYEPFLQLRICYAVHCLQEPWFARVSMEVSQCEKDSPSWKYGDLSNHSQQQMLTLQGNWTSCFQVSSIENGRKVRKTCGV